ncbi:FtsW/RodA/SpoVE family cell cycle protein [Flavihumibacter petaseus]|uniref:Cell division protein/penicillin-binding protein n=1 Tax=Flavihumibacter petaseus NBRC 106054 TaxID=1220578 RepID=A0A0E9MTG8_9BACT|nr:FtsW/RodA/SpoVE family cell cycle protein [Flavihumibacter petaseus]GAO41057.1 cell division protein/penicillin-binding protein [Flavihumibacter petaseus NBRC 106054]
MSDKNKKSWLLLGITAMVVLGLFLRLYTVLSPRLDKAALDLQSNNALVLQPGVSKTQLQRILDNGSYCTDAADVKLIADSLSAKLVVNGVPANLGELNKQSWFIAAPLAWKSSYGGTDWNDRLAAARQTQGFDSALYVQERKGGRSLASVITAGKGNGKISGTVLINGLASAGVLVSLQEHRAGEQEEEENKFYVRTDTDGKFSFAGLYPDSGYSVLPLKPGFAFGGRQGTASLGGDRSFTFTGQPHRLRLIGALAYGQLKEDNVLLVRSPDSFRRQFWLIAGLLIAGFLVVQAYLSIRRIETDPLILPVLMLLTGLAILMLLCIQQPLTDSLLAMQSLQGLLAGLLGFALLAGSNPGKLYTRWWYDGLFNYKRREIFGLKGYTWLVAALLLAVITLLFGTGPEGSGVKVNLRLAGILFQPSEITKYLLILFMAGFFAANEDHLRHISDSRNRLILGFFMMAGIAMLLALYLLMGDMGPALVVCFSFLVFLSIARGNLPYTLLAAVVYGGLLYFLPAWMGTAIAFVFSLLLLTFNGSAKSSQWYGSFAVLAEAPVLILVVMAAFVFGDQLPGIGSRLAERKSMWLNPWNNDVYGGDHLAHAYWTLSSGGWKGQGLGKGFPNTLPAAHTDMILPGIGEEMGWAGLLLVFLLLGILLYRILLLSRRSGQPFSFYLGSGIAIATGIQVLLMGCGSTGLLPLTGLAVPFLSYGKISLIVNCCALGVIAGISARSGTSKQQEHISARYDTVIVAAVVGIMTGIVVILGKLFMVQISDRDQYLVQQSRVVNRNGVPIYSYNPRIDKLAAFLAAGNITDRNGLLLATSQKSAIRQQRDSLVAAGVDGLQLQALQHRRLRRLYPFGENLFFWTGDYNTRLFWAQQNGYFAEARHLSALRGFETHPVKQEQLAMAYRPDRFTRPVEKSVELVRYDYSALIPSLRNGLDSSNNAIREILQSPRDVRLTVDAALQKEIEDSLQRSAFTGKRIAVVVLDAASGELLASAVHPLPDLKHPELLGLPDRERRQLDFPVTERDLGMTYATAPGSTVKILTAMAALNKMGTAAAAEKYRDISRSEIFRDNAKEQEPFVPQVPFVDMREAIIHSSNIFFIRMANEHDLEDEMASLYLSTGMRINQTGGFDYTSALDPERKHETLDNWHRTALNHDRKLFNNPANIGRKKRYLSDFSGIAWGQGTLTATPVSMARMAGAIALDGSMQTSRYLSEISGRQPDKVPAAPLARDSSYARLIRNFMIEQSNPPGRPKIKSVRVAGKTGTPERIVKSEKTADGWYVFFAPVPGKPSATVTCIRIEEGLSSANAVVLGNTVAQILLKRNYVESY